MPEHEIADHEPVSQLGWLRTRKFKGYCSDTDKNVLSMADEEPSFSDEDTVSCDGRPSEGA